MHDPVSMHLLELYETIYNEYFELYCLMVKAEDEVLADAIRFSMQDAHKRAKAVRQRLYSEKPDDRHSDFEREALLARSGRYPVLNYMVG